MAAKQKTLQDLFHDTLKDIYFAEKKILSALPKMAKAAQSEDLKAAFQKHETETEEHVARLEKVFEEIDETPRGKTCAAVMGLNEAGKLLETTLSEEKKTDETLTKLAEAGVNQHAQAA